MGKQSESVGISLEVRDVIPEDLTDLRLKFRTLSFRKECLDGLLTTMTEGWITQVVCQTGCADNGTDLWEQRAGQFRLTFQDTMRHIIS